MFSIATLLISIPALPLAACLLTAALGKRAKGQAYVPTVMALALAFICSLLLLFDVRSAAEEQSRSMTGTGYEQVATLWTWTTIPDALATDHGPAAFSIDVTLRADPLTCIMLAMVTGIALLVAVFSAGYMRGDPGESRFFSIVSLFVFSMTMLVSVSNFVLLYVFWEAVGMCSYLLIGFWYQKPAAAAAGKKAFLVNRIGDVGFSLGLFLIWTTYGTLNFHDAEAPGVIGVLGQTRLANPALFVGGGVATAICLLLMLGACGKSAQFPLHVWLPDAMEGPTPVSALIHAATMVTAGVYMVTRCAPLFAASPDAQLVVSVIGGFTALLAGLIALTQTDLKRVLAYSTISQLGYMFLSLGTGSLLGLVAGMFHLFTHAFFKALLFLGSGSVMHAMGGVIDMRRFGGLRKILPVTHWTFLCGSLALAGVVPFAGFWSKDLILDAVHHRGFVAQAHASAEQNNVQRLLVMGQSTSNVEDRSMLGADAAAVYRILFYAAVGTAFLTAFYTFRAFFMTFYGKLQVPSAAEHHAHESPPSMTVPLVVLAICALAVGGYFFLTGSFDHFLRQTPSLKYAPIADTAPRELWNPQIAGISTAVALGGIALAAFLYLGSRAQVEWLARWLRPAYALSYGKFYFDGIYQTLIVWPLTQLARLAYWLDRTLIDGLVNWIGWAPAAVGAGLRSLQSGLVQMYALLMVLGLLVLLAALLLGSGG